MNSKLPVNVDIQDIWQKDKDHVIHPWTDFTTFKEEGSLIMSKGENVFVYDVYGALLHKVLKCKAPRIEPN
ncbi:hypothetical protein, partial [Acinetobacter johnsonii]